MLSDNLKGNFLALASSEQLQIILLHEQKKKIFRH